MGENEFVKFFVKFFLWTLTAFCCIFAATTPVINQIIQTNMRTNTSFLRTVLLAATLFLVNPMHAWEPNGFSIRIQLSLAEIQPGQIHPRTPIEAPQVGQSDHTLYFPDEIDLFLNIYSVDEDGEETLEYATAVPSTTTSVQLPASLSCTYIIEVVHDGLYFRGEIEL